MKFLPKRILACVLAALLCLSLGSAAVTAAGAPSVTVALSYQADNSGFYIAPHEMTIAADLAETHGYTDDFGGTKVSALDAVVAAHVLIFGDDPADIQAVLDVSSAGYMMDFMGSGANCGYFVNDVLPDVATAVELFAGDVIDLHTYQDSSAMDVRAWFELDGSKVTGLQLLVDEEIDLVVNGIEAAGWGDWAMPEDVVWGAQIVLAELDDSAGFPVAYFDAPFADTDMDGEFTLSFDTAGTYYVSAIEEDDPYVSPFMSPWLVVTVITPEQVALAEAKTEAKEELEEYKAPADYRDAQKAELTAAIEAGKAAIAAAADETAVEAALANAKAAIDAIKTDAQLTAEESAEEAAAFEQAKKEAAAALAKAKTDAKAALDSYKDSAEYRDEQKAELAAAIAAGKAAIDAAKDEAGVASALAVAKTAMNKIKTDEQMKEDSFIEKLLGKIPDWAKDAVCKVWNVLRWVAKFMWKYRWFFIFVF